MTKTIKYTVDFDARNALRRLSARISGHVTSDVIWLQQLRMRSRTTHARARTHTSRGCCNSFFVQKTLPHSVMQWVWAGALNHCVDGVPFHPRSAQSSPAGGGGGGGGGAGGGTAAVGAATRDRRPPAQPGRPARPGAVTFSGD